MDLFLPVAAASNMTTNKTERQAVCSKRPCAEHSSCSSCTQSSCMWCSNLALCIDTNAYVASFPYGQCMDWTTKQDKCNGQCGFDGGQGRLEVGGGSRWLYYQVQLWWCVYVCVGGGGVRERERESCDSWCCVHCIFLSIFPFYNFSYYVHIVFHCSIHV